MTRKYLRIALRGVVTTGSVVVLAACGSSNRGTSGSATSASHVTGGPITIDAAVAPTSADQGKDFTPQGNELYSVVNTPLLVFKRGVQGVGGAKILPGLARDLPTVSDGGKTLTFHLRSGLRYSDGRPVRASDEQRALERDIKLRWGLASFIRAFVVGGEAYARGNAKSLSGVQTNDATGTITVHLVMPFGPMVDLFALPGSAPVPGGTPMANQAHGTLGDGPYKWGPISPGHIYTLIKNPSFNGVPTVPEGHANKIVFSVNGDVLQDAEAVLNNRADVFDPTDQLPSSILQRVKSQAASRYKQVPTNSTYYFFFAVNRAPFNNVWARKAVLAALNLRALSKLDSGFLTEDCHLIPSGMPGRSGPSTCISLTGHSPTGVPNMTLAKTDMAKCHCSGARVEVWGPAHGTASHSNYVGYYTRVLDSLGFKAKEQLINAGVYFGTVGNSHAHPQTGFSYWVQDFPNPWDFMQLFSGSAVPALNYGYVNDPHYDSTVNKLDSQPLARLDSLARQWSALDDYAVGKAYYAAFGHEEFPKFYSNRLNFGAGVVSVAYETDLTSLALK